MRSIFILLLLLGVLPFNFCEIIPAQSDDLIFAAEDIVDESNNGLQREAALTKRTWIPCSDYQICTERDRILWKSKRKIVEYLLQAKKASEIGPFVEKDSPLVLSIRNRTSLCEDYTTAPFLMNKTSEHWPIGCVWSGGQTIGACAPAPPSDSFTYISPTEWSRKVKQFRTAIGCSKAQIKAAQDVGELYICRERCMDIGLGYWQAIILSLGCVLFMTAIIILN